ncbi:MAG: HD family phosphohydrolase [Limnothrix sp. BL-A-16]
MLTPANPMGRDGQQAAPSHTDSEASAQEPPPRQGSQENAEDTVEPVGGRSPEPFRDPSPGRSPLGPNSRSVSPPGSVPPLPPLHPSPSARRGFGQLWPERLCWLNRRLSPLVQRVTINGGVGVIRGACHSLCCQTMGQPYVRRARSIRQRVQTILLGILGAVILTATMSQPWLNQPRYGIGSIAPQDIVAPYDAQVVDQVTTRSRREAARNGIVPALKIDSDATQQLTAELQRRLERSDELRQVAGQFPYWSSADLASDLQQIARSLNEADWQQVLQALGKSSPRPTPLPTGRSEDFSSFKPSLASGKVLPISAEHPLVVALKTYQIQASEAALRKVISAIEKARERYAMAQTVMQDFGQQDYTVDLFILTDTQWQATRAKTLVALENLLVQGLAPGLPPELVERAVQLHVALVVPLEGRALAQQLLLGTIDRPTLTEDPDRTRRLAEQAAEDVPLSIVSRRMGETIVRQGERIDAGQFALLDRYGLSSRNVNWGAILRLFLLVSGAIVAFWQIERRVYHRLRQRDCFLLLLLAISTPLLISMGAAWPWASPTILANLSAIGLLSGSFYGSLVGMSLVGLLALLLPPGLEVSWVDALIVAAGGLVAAAWAGRARSREDLALLGGGVAIAQGGLYLVMNLINSAAAEFVWLTVLGSAALCGFAGLIWVIIAIGLSPYLEHLFDLVTPIRLAELANPNRPLLKQLAAEAPGTFQHTLFVASLAEAAARSLGCNVELVRAGTLYHDIGKLHKPQAFIENQMGGPNLHDELADPWLSAEIVRKHVSEGLVMARRARLPKAIQAFIPEHQGTMLIAYFYYQAKQQQEQREQRAKVANFGLEQTPVERLNRCDRLDQAGQANQAHQPDRATTAIETTQQDKAPQGRSIYQACALDQRPVLESHFRYPGPIPQSRETGIVMLADSCEAALRSLENATYEEALALVNRMLRARWQDNQLVCSGLSREDLRVIAEVFVTVWQQFNHKRIAYPKAALNVPDRPAAEPAAGSCAK